MSDPVASPSDNRFTIVTPDDRSGVIWIVTILCATYSALLLPIRWVIKKKVLGADDYVFTAALAFAIAEYVAVFVGLSNGLGKSFTILNNGKKIDIESVIEVVIACHVLALLALCLAKCSIILLIRRLFARDMVIQTRISNGLVILVGIWGVASAIAANTKCSSSDSFENGIRLCPDEMRRWEAIAAFDATTELLIVGLSAMVIWHLQFSLGDKIRVVVAFVFRLPLIAFAILELYAMKHPMRYHPESSTPTNGGVAIARPLIILNMAICWSLISSTIPNLKGFIRSFGSAMGMVVPESSRYGHGSSNKNTNDHSVDSSVKPTDISLHDLRPDDVTHKYDIRASRAESSSIDGDAHSQELIIRRDVQWNVQYGRDEI